MSHRLFVILLVVSTLGCGDDGDAPTGPTSITVSQPAGSTIFIGTQAQLTATGNSGTTVTNATWTSDAPAIATVSSAGLVNPIAAGEATITASTSSATGTLRIRVFPHFQGTWTGSAVMTECVETGDFVGALCEDFPVGLFFAQDVKFVQNGASVAAEVLFDDLKSNMTGTISIGGELTLPSALVTPDEPLFDVQTQNWRSRSDVVGRLTGSYEWLWTAPGLNGSIRQAFQLQNVTRTSTTTAVSSRTTASKAAMTEHLARELARKR